ncbi:MAG: hypothetical protein R2747_07855 [Pyrinomonadaceae bacterium]
MKNANPILKGWISEYWEQGMEGTFFRVFQDENLARDRFSGWRPEGMHILSEGDLLTIFSPEKEVLWTGLIEPRRCGFLKLKKLHPANSDWTPENVSPEDWEGWFRFSPPLEATFRSGKL